MKIKLLPPLEFRSKGISTNAGNNIRGFIITIKDTVDCFGLYGPSAYYRCPLSWRKYCGSCLSYGSTYPCNSGCTGACYGPAAGMCCDPSCSSCFGSLNSTCNTCISEVKPRFFKPNSDTEIVYHQKLCSDRTNRKTRLSSSMLSFQARYIFSKFPHLIKVSLSSFDEKK